MGTIALITGLLGAICGIIGILVAVEVMPDTGYAAMTLEFWLMLSGIFFLSSIAISVGKGGGGGYAD